MRSAHGFGVFDGWEGKYGELTWIWGGAFRGEEWEGLYGNGWKGEG